MTRLALGLALALLVAGAAHADTLIELPNTMARLELPDKWMKIESETVVALYQHPAGSLLVVIRLDAPNAEAWGDDAKKKQRYADGIEVGIKGETPGYKRIAKKLHDVNGVPAFDLESRSKDGSTSVFRFLLFRTYSLSLAITVPKQGDIAVARAIAAKFAPPATK